MQMALKLSTSSYNGLRLGPMIESIVEVSIRSGDRGYRKVYSRIDLWFRYFRYSRHLQPGFQLDKVQISIYEALGDVTYTFWSLYSILSKCTSRVSACAVLKIASLPCLELAYESWAHLVLCIILSLLFSSALRCHAKTSAELRDQRKFLGLFGTHLTSVLLVTPSRPVYMLTPNRGTELKAVVSFSLIFFCLGVCLKRLLSSSPFNNSLIRIFLR